MASTRLGTLYGVAAYAMWGLFPLYWPLLEPAGAVEILSHRVVWSLLVVAVLVAILRLQSSLRTLIARPGALPLLVGAAFVIAINWATYIYGVNSDQVVETSLGYFVNPLVTVLFGVVFLAERMRPLQWAAIGVAAIAVAVLTIDYGRPPWIALTLAVSFATYGLLKKKAGAGAVESLAIETAVLFVPVLTYLGWLAADGRSTFGHEGAGHATLLIASGVVTAIPLLCFGAAATRVPLTTLGLLQYLAPTIQFVLGVTVNDEPMPAVRMIGFSLVWLALAMFTAEIVRHRRRQLRLAVDAVG